MSHINVTLWTLFLNLGRFWIVLDHVSLQFAWFCSYKITQSANQVILKLSRWKKSYVTFFGFHNIQFNSVSCLDVFFQICLTLQCFITDIALDCASIFIHVFFHISCCSECSRTSFTLVCLFITHTFCHMTASAVVWNSFLTVFACNFSVRFHVCLQLPPSNAGLLTLITIEDTIVMLIFNMHFEMFFRRSFKVTNGTRRHGDREFVLPMMFWIPCMMNFPYQKQKRLKWIDNNQCKRCWPI